jgi:mono/diheme cytochrome c family protein
MTAPRIDNRRAVPRGPVVCLAAGTALLCAVASVGCDAPGKPSPKQRPLQPDQVTDFATLFSQNCSGCHGVEGLLGPAPPLNDAIFLAIISEDQMRRVVSDGRRNSLMPAFAQSNGGALTSKQIDIIVSGVRREWGQESIPERQDLPTYLVSDAGQRASPSHAVGEKAFASACAGCHGEQGEGGPMAGPLRDPAFLELVSDQALRRVIITGRPDLGMPDYRSSDGRTEDFKPLTNDEITAIVNLLRSWRKHGDVAQR